MVYCSACDSTNLEQLTLHLAEVKSMSAAQDGYMSELEQEYREGRIGVKDVQKAYKVSDRLEAEISHLEEKIAAIGRISARRRHQ